MNSRAAGGRGPRRPTGVRGRDPPRLGIADPADGNRNLCAGSHDVQRVLKGSAMRCITTDREDYLTRFFNVEDALTGTTLIDDEDDGLSSSKRERSGGERADRPGRLRRWKVRDSPPPDI